MNQLRLSTVSISIWTTALWKQTISFQGLRKVVLIILSVTFFSFNRHRMLYVAREPSLRKPYQWHYKWWLISSGPHYVQKALQWIRVTDCKQPFCRSKITKFWDFIFYINRKKHFPVYSYPHCLTLWPANTLVDSNILQFVLQIYVLWLPCKSVCIQT